MKKKAWKPLDAWSLGHLLGGAILGSIGLAYWTGPVIVVGYEVLEAGLRRIPYFSGGVFEKESWANIVGDVVTGLLGFTLAWWLLPDPSWDWPDWLG